MEKNSPQNHEATVSINKVPLLATKYTDYEISTAWIVTRADKVATFHLRAGGRGALGRADQNGTFQIWTNDVNI